MIETVSNVLLVEGPYPASHPISIARLAEVAQRANGDWNFYPWTYKCDGRRINKQRQPARMHARGPVAGPVRAITQDGITEEYPGGVEEAAHRMQCAMSTIYYAISKHRLCRKRRWSRVGQQHKGATQ